MDYFFYCRDRAGTGELRSKLVEEHWSFMDRYADGMIARGPTLTPDRAAATGSVHIVDLPDAEAARVFAYEEPNYLAGVYDEVLIHRWRDLLGRTMWEFPGGRAGGPRFLVLGLGEPVPDDETLRAAHRRHHLDGGHRDRLVACGQLLSGDGTRWTGTATLAELPDQAAAAALAERDPYARAGLYTSVEVHAWEFGGRRD